MLLVKQIFIWIFRGWFLFNYLGENVAKNWEWVFSVVIGYTFSVQKGQALIGHRRLYKEVSISILSLLNPHPQSWRIFIGLNFQRFKMINLVVDDANCYKDFARPDRTGIMCSLAVCFIHTCRPSSRYSFGLMTWIFLGVSRF
jgi:hypothetical protein